MISPQGIFRQACRWVFIPILWTAVYCIVLYIALPSWTVSDINVDGLRAFQHRPLKHNTMSSFVTRVFETQTFYPRGYRYGKEAIFDRQFFAFDIAVDTGAIVLRSPGSSEHFECEEGQQLGEIKYPMVIVADQNEVSIFPWGSIADSALLFADTRSVVSEKSLGMAPMRSFCQFRIDLDDDGKEVHPEVEWDYALSLLVDIDSNAKRPMLTIGVSDKDSIRTVRWVEFGGKSGVNHVSKDGIRRVSAPSRTYQLRKMMMGIIAPTAVGLANNNVMELLFSDYEFGESAYYLQKIIYALAVAVLFVYVKSMSSRNKIEESLAVQASSEHPIDSRKERGEHQADVLIDVETNAEEARVLS